MYPLTVRLIIYRLKQLGWKIVVENSPTRADFLSCVVYINECTTDINFSLAHEYGHILLARECYVYWGSEAEDFCDYYAFRILGFDEPTADILMRRRKKLRKQDKTKFGPLLAKPYLRICKRLGPPLLP